MEELSPCSLGKSKAFLVLWGEWGLLGSLWGRHISGCGQRWVVRPLK